MAGEFDYYTCTRCGEEVYGPDLAFYSPPICGDCITPQDYKAN